MPGEDLSEYYTIPVILSMAGVEKQVNDQLGKAGARGGKEFMSSFTDGARSSEADMKRALDGVNKMQDKAADAAGRRKTAEAGLQDLIEKGITSGQRYVRATQAVEKSKRDETRATKTATDALKDYEQAAKNAESAGSGMGAGMLASLRGAASGAASAGGEAATGFVEGFAGSSALLQLGARGGPVGIAIAVAGVALGGLLWQNVMAGVDREPGRDLVQARLGASEQEMAALGRISGEVYANNFGESRDEALRASQLAIQGGLVSDAFDPALQDVSEKLLAISQLVGGEVEQTAKSASILLRSNMAGSAEEAFDIIAKGYKVTGDLGADWLDSLGEYSIGWKNAGLTATQALALIKQGQDFGVDVTDRSADALREFGRRLTEEGPKMIEVIDAIGLNGQAMYDKFKSGGPAAFEAFDQLFDKIRAIEDPADRGQAVLAILGDTAGDFSEAFERWDPSAAVNSLGAIEGAAQSASDTMGDNVAGSFEELKRTADVALEDVQDSLAEAFGPSLEELADGVKEHKDDIALAFTEMGVFAISGAQAAVQAVGEGTVALGQLIGGVGNTLGALTDANAWVQDMLGRDDIAEQLRKDAQEYYGWGDALEQTGEDMRANAKDMDTWKEKLRKATDGVGDADTSVGNLGQSFGKLNTEVKNLPPTLPSWFGDLAKGVPAQLPILAPGSDPFAIPGGPGGTGPAPTIPGLSPTGSGGSGVGINLQAAAGASGKKLYTGPHTEDTGGAIVPENFALQQNVLSAFPGAGINNDYRQKDGFNEHSSGEAVDISVNPGGKMGVKTPEGQKQGDAINAWILQNAAALGVQYTIWQGRNWNPDGTSSPNSGTGVTGGHWDHVHARVKPGAASGSDTFSQPASLTSSYSTTTPTYQGIAGPNGASGPASPNLVNAFGAGYEPGIGTPGYNEYGDPGYYETDPRRIAQADRGARDSQRRITDADQAIVDNEAAVAEAKAEVDRIAKMTAIERVTEKADLDKANADLRKAEDRAERSREDAQRAREDAQWAQEDLQEAQKGSFKQARQSKKTKGGSGDLSGIGSIFSSFLGETFGLDGSWLPDIGNLMPLQMVDTLLSTFAGGSSDVTGASPTTSGAPFGVPDIMAPPMPPPGVHNGTGFPGPAGVTQINDLSTTYQGGVGLSPDELAKQNERNQSRGVARLGNIPLARS